MSARPGWLPPSFIQLHVGPMVPVFLDANRVAAVAYRQAAGGCVVSLVGGSEGADFFVLESPEEVFAAITGATA